MYIKQFFAHNITAVKNRNIYDWILIIMNTNEEMLQFLHKSAKMSVDSTTKLLSKTENRELRAELLSEINGYKRFERESSALLRSHGLKPQNPGMGVKLMSDVGMAVNTMMDSSTSHIAEIMINGSNMGVIKMSKHLNRNGDCPEKTRNLCSDMISYEKHRMEKLSSYLR